MSDEQKEVLKTLLPYLLCTAALTAAFVLGVVRLGHLGTRSAPANIVTFDIIRYTNAQRAFASKFMTNQVPDDAALLMDLSKKTRTSISKIAGNSTVIVKQTVVQGDIPDITEDVLKDLGLPTNVPTQDPATYSIDDAPTNFILPQMIRAREAQKAALPLAASGGGVLP
jgi:hypothetical protein